MNYFRYGITLSLLLLASGWVSAQKPHQRTASEIRLALKKLNFLGSALYVAAHPDDENTRLIAYLSNEVLANTAYLSMTRGDGGQNLIGPEIREYLGIIRTQELLAARRIDGGSQFFTRANDFGYSKSPEETQDIWERDEVLSDVVWVMRKFRPDVVICRFPTDGGGGHGHHTTSAILAHEAFDIADDDNRFEDQLKYVEPWQPTRLFLNTGRWWNPDIDASKPGVISVDVGEFNPLLGSSYTETAAISRTQHKSQGFGSTGSRGSSMEYLEHRKGDEATEHIFEGINTSWSRVQGGKPIEKKINTILANYNPEMPEKSVPALIEVYGLIEKIDDDYWKNIKLTEVKQIIQDCMGLYLEAVADDYMKTPGDSVDLRLEAVNRSEISARLQGLNASTGQSKPVGVLLEENNRELVEWRIHLPQDIPLSQPYWLRKPGSLGMYNVGDRELIGLPENEASVMVEVDMEINGKDFSFDCPLVYKWNDPVKGEQYRPFVISPPAFIQMSEQVLVFPDNRPVDVEVTVKSAIQNLKAELQAELPAGWDYEFSEPQIMLEDKGEEQRISIRITPPSGDSEGSLKLSLLVDGEMYGYDLVTISYDHIPVQTVFPPSEARLVKVGINHYGDRIGYIQGAGDEIPASLRNVGYDVWEMSDEEIIPENLKDLDAVILGVRALNTRDRLAFVMEDLLEYAYNGGTLILQYNTTRGLITDEFAPYPLQLSRDRVSVEEAPVTILADDHPVLNRPNKITSGDFEDWVQERGLYFPDEWDERYTAVLSSHDPGEPDRKGGLLVARYGKGYYIYTGYSFFRELPAGVPGALKLFVNLVSLGSSGEGAEEETSGQDR